MTPELSIIIVHWNTPELLAACINSIRERENRLKFEIIVVDNNSDDDIAKLPGLPKDDLLRIIRMETNIGFGRACNRGAELAQSETLLFLGPDTKCIQNDAVLQTLTKYKTLPKAGALSCQLINGDGSLQRHYFNLPRADRIIYDWYREFTNHIPIVHRARKKRQPSELEPVDMVIAHWMMVSKTAFSKAGGFPDNAFMFGDDIEFNKKLLDAGYSNYLYRGCQAMHYGGSSTKKRYVGSLTYVVQDSITRFCFRHYGPVGGSISVILIILRAVSSILFISPLYIGRGFRSYFLDHWQVIWHYLAYQWRPGKIKKISGEA
ncbi:glycosyltransferase family 2 protein [Patescibacteria group bacterium]|nr:glycosyltransferase family 2 protein [Patescibacteria group bacterium]MBU1449227.1 glycosyltransferase family 2 protein [Patescibacteria group bacterium]MBU2594198.1 glycosyltransferase family 2 protein [Candidatus Edwardsbacteria bacterium]